MNSIYQRRTRLAPDSAFVPGTLPFLVPGNQGRLLDPRRTPIQVVRLLDASALVHLQVLQFEDAGAIWEWPAEHVQHLQFHRSSAVLPSATVKRLTTAIARFQRPVTIPADPRRARETERRLVRLIPAASRWLKRHSAFLRTGLTLPTASRTGPVALRKDCAAYLELHGLRELDDRLATMWASQNGGELIRCLQMAMARMGVIPYRGPRIRDQALETRLAREGILSRYILHRLAFLRSYFAALNRPTLTVYRGMSSDRGWAEIQKVWSSWTPLARVARCHADFDPFGPHRGRSTDSYLIKRTFPIRQIFMTYFETEALNRTWKETEVIVLHREGDGRLF